MTVTYQLKIIDNKIKANHAQYDLDRLSAKISAYSSGEFRKYENLTGEDLGYKPSALEEKKCDYSPLGKIFNKGFTEEDTREGLLKSVKNIKDKNEELLKEIKDQKRVIRIVRHLKLEILWFMTKIKTTNHKYQLDKFSNMLSIESKFDTLKFFYRDFISLKNLEARTTENIDHRPVVLNSALEESGKLIKEYKNVYEREPKGDKSYG